MLIKNSVFIFKYFSKKNDIIVNNDNDDNKKNILDAQTIATTADDNKLTSPSKMKEIKFSLLIIAATKTPIKKTKLQTDSVVSDDSNNNNNNNILESTIMQCII